MSTVHLLVADEVAALLDGAEAEIIEVVRACYVAQEKGRCTVPPSAFLRPPADASRRHIALVGQLDDDAPVAGMKWVSSSITNLDRSLPRASAVIVLNCVQTGRATAILEGSLISAKRTAASAALAAEALGGRDPAAVKAFVGCGVVNREVVRFLGATGWRGRALACDCAPERAAAFRAFLAESGWEPTIERDASAALAAADLSAIATSATEPYLPHDLRLRPGSVHLHLSLRDFHPATLSRCHNFVDSAEHAMREGTSLGRAAAAHGPGVVGSPIGAIVGGWEAVDAKAGTPRVFSPFGMASLDLSLARFVVERAKAAGVGRSIPFHPAQ